MCLWSSKGLEIHQSPVYLGCLKTSTQPLWGRKSEADASSALPNSWAPKMGQWPHRTTAPTLPHPLAIWLTQRLMGLWSHLYFRGVRGGAVPAGEGGNAKASSAWTWNIFPLKYTVPFQPSFGPFEPTRTTNGEKYMKRVSADCRWEITAKSHERGVITAVLDHFLYPRFCSVCESDIIGQEWRCLPTSISKEGKITMLWSAIQTDML